jgi:gliding motility-associated transport system ATP-binding protein
MADNAIITVEGLRKTYGSRPAVDGITFNVNKGEVLGFLGPNGAGKTTTMKILTCFISPTAGTARVSGYDVFESPLEVRKCLGYLPENAPIYGDMTVLEFLEFVSDVRDVPAGDRAKKIKRVTDICGLGDRLVQEIRTLSKGYRQRVGIAQAMVHEPPILILDEPTSGLDPNQIVEIREVIKEIGRQRTVILSTHNLPEVQASCDRVLIINKGKLVADGKPSELSIAQRGHRYTASVLKPEGVDAERVRQGFASLPGVEDARIADGEAGTVAVVLGGGKDDLRPALFKAAVDKGWTLVELKRETIALEDIFRGLTVAGQDPAKSEAA